MPLTSEEIEKRTDAIPNDLPKSKLQPFLASMLKWRKQRRSYERIAGLLAEHFDITISSNQVGKFLRQRSRQPPPEPQTRITTEPPPMNRPETASAVRVRFDKPAAAQSSDAGVKRFVFVEGTPIQNLNQIEDKNK